MFAKALGPKRYTPGPYSRRFRPRNARVLSSRELVIKRLGAHFVESRVRHMSNASESPFAFLRSLRASSSALSASNHKNRRPHRYLIWTKKSGAERSPAPPQAPSSGALCFISALDALLEPVQHFLLDPPDPALAELYPLGKRSCLLKAGDVLRAVQYKLLELTLR